MLQQQTLVTAVCDYCHTPALTRRDFEDVPALFEDEDQARRSLGLDEPDNQTWRELKNRLLICPRCAFIRDCVLNGGHDFRGWITCGCIGRFEGHTVTAGATGLLAGVCDHDQRGCTRCATVEYRLRGAHPTAAAFAVPGGELP
jgi:hypothetical protein